MFFREFPGKSNQSKHGRNLTQEHRTTLLTKCIINKPVFATSGGGHYSCSVPCLYSWVNQERQVFLTESRNEANGKSSGSMQTPRTYLDYYIYILFTESGQDAPLIWGEQYDTNRWKPVRLCLSVHRLYSPSVQQQNRRKKLTANSGSYSIQR